MHIESVKLRNFKSFAKVDVKFGKLNVLVGPNAVGKSNFIQLFKFLHDVASYGLDDAISIQGGFEYLRNYGVGVSSRLSVDVSFNPTEDVPPIRKFRSSKVLLGWANYKFTLEPTKSGHDCRVVEDVLRLTYVPSSAVTHLSEYTGPKGSMTIRRSGGASKIRISMPRSFGISKSELREAKYFLGRLSTRPVVANEKSLLIEEPLPLLTSLMPFSLASRVRGFDEIRLYDIDPKLPKRAIPVTGRAGLEEDGGNLPLVLRRIVENEKDRREYSNLVQRLLPFVEKVRVDRFADKSMLLSVKETFAKKRFVPASVISDGTINVLALVVALYFESKSVAAIEEPERNIHPHLISQVVEMLLDAARKKQIFVTTHNPEMVRSMNLKDLYLITRGKGGFSNITRPMNVSEVKSFLESGMGLDELFVQNLLGG